MPAVQKAKQQDYGAVEEPNEYLRRYLESYRNFAYEIAKSLAKKKQDAEQHKAERPISTAG